MPRSTPSATRSRHAYGPRPGASVADGLLTRTDPTGARLLERALRSLTGSAFLLPRLGGVWLWGEEIVVEVADPPAGPPPGHWRAGDDPRRWFLGREGARAYEDGDLAADTAAHAHVVAVGRDGDLRLLLNLDAGTGLGAVTGPARLRGTLLEAVAAELATTEWSSRVRITCVGTGHEAGSLFPDRVDVLPDLAALFASPAAATAWADGGSGRPDPAAVLTGWAPRPEDPAATTDVILIGTEPSPEEARRLARLAARCGRTGPRILVGTHLPDLPGAGYAVDLDQDGRVTAPLLGVGAAPRSAPPGRARPVPKPRVERPPSWSAVSRAPGPARPAAGIGRWRLTAVLPGGAEQDVVLEVGDAVRVSVVAERLLARLDRRRAETESLDRRRTATDLFTSEGERLAPDLPLARVPLYDGCRVFLGAPPTGAFTPELDAEKFARFSDLYVSPAQAGTLAFDRQAATGGAAAEPEGAAAEREDAAGVRTPAAPPARRNPVRSLYRRVVRGREPTVVSGGEPSPDRAAITWYFGGPKNLPGAVFGPKTLLWERDSGHLDSLRALLFHVGQGNGSTHFLTIAPDGLGLVGDRRVARGLAGWIVAQLAFLHSPSDVAVRVLTDESGRDAWQFARWLPPDGLMARGGPRPRISREPAGHLRQLDEAALIIHERLRREREAVLPADHTALVIVLDDPAALNAAPWAAETLRAGRDVGVCVIHVAEDERKLFNPHGPRFVAGAEGFWTYQREREPDVGSPRCTPDTMPPAQLDALARLVAPLRAAPADPEAPPAEHLLDLLDLDPPTAERIADRWQGTPRSAAAVLGGSAGRPLVLDLLADGPHALMAGTAGSGTEELLCAWLASLAVANRPDELNLLFVHHDGGEAFAPVAGLPHTVGVHTALDPYAAARGLTALTAEVRRRRKLMKEAGARDFEQYTVIRSSGAELPALARLVLVVCDLAHLREDVPEFVPGLIDAIRRGPGLGIHVILATRRPSDALTPDELAFAPLRIVLRLADPADSELLIGTPAAARLPRGEPRLAYVRRASGALDLVRRAHLEEPSEEPAAAGHDTLSIRLTDWTGATEPRADRASGGGATGGDPFAALVDATARAAETLDTPPAPHVPWPPPLPPSVRLTETAAGQDTPWPVRPRPGARTPVVFGLRDAPGAQGFEQAAWDLRHDGPLLVPGDAGSGRTQLLLTLAAAVAEQYGVEDVHLYAIDSAGALAGLTELDHCGAVVTLDETERMRRLVDKLVDTVRSRQELFARTGVRTLHEYRRERGAGNPPPYLVLLLDGWREFRDWAVRTANDSCLRDLFRLLRDTRTGICPVVTGGEEVFDIQRGFADATTLVLRQAGPAGYERAGLAAHRLPPFAGPGRALFAGSGVEVQIALPDRIQETANAARQRNAGVPLVRRPFRIQSSALAADRFSLGPEGRPVGREDVFAWLDRNLRDGTPAALLGPRRAGKSWIVKALQERMRSDGVGNVQKVVTLANRAPGGTQDELAVRLVPSLAGADRPADELMDRAAQGSGSSRLVLLLDEVGRLTGYEPTAVSWLRDLGQAGAWLVYCGTYKDWSDALHHALAAPGSSFGNDVNHFSLGPLAEAHAREFLVGTAENESVAIPPATADRILRDVGPWPFYLQVVGDALVRAARAGNTLALDDPGELGSLIERELLVNKADVFRSRWSEIPPAGRQALLDARGAPQPRALTAAQGRQLRDVGLLLAKDKWLPDRPFFDWIDLAHQELADAEEQR
ncbi:FtsK/SpoIIIE domain-containing protein [Streptomyces sp. NPDC008313]|uniref:FtsK/SpoIIIE domain-containing protein n=1 Tax=Streptomyces sp. NPDC008313 TaxID=3364826 RepID=UPI0036ED5533